MKLITRSMLGLAALFAACPALAEEAGAASSNMSLGYIGAGLAIGLAVLGGGTGQGRAAAAALEGICRNPQSSDKVFTPLLISLALIEFQAIMGFIIAIMLVLK